MSAIQIGYYYKYKHIFDPDSMYVDIAGDHDCYFM